MIAAHHGQPWRGPGSVGHDHARRSRRRSRPRGRSRRGAGRTPRPSPSSAEHRRLDRAGSRGCRRSGSSSSATGTGSRPGSSPPTTGRTPVSPALIRATDERTYSLAELATSSAGDSQLGLPGRHRRSAPRPESRGAVGSSTFDTLSPPPFAAPADCRDEPPVVMRSTTIWRSSSAAGRTATMRPRWRTAMRSATSKTSFMLWEMMSTACPRSASRRTSSSTIARLRDAERGRRLVHDHELGVPQHRLGDRDRLALAAGERGDRLADRPHRRDGRLASVSCAAVSICSSSRMRWFVRSRPRNMFWTMSRLSQSARSW